MALPWALAVLSLLPLLNAQDSACHLNYTRPITNATLDQIVAHRWFYIASAYQNPEDKKMISLYQFSFFNFGPNYTENTILLKDYITVNDMCSYNVSYMNIRRENGTMSTLETGKELFAYLILTKDPGIFMLALNPEDKENMGLTFYVNSTEVTQEQMEQFHENLKCMGMDKSEIIYVDMKKNQCGPLEKQHNEEKKKEKDAHSPKEEGK